MKSTMFSTDSTPLKSLLPCEIFMANIEAGNEEQLLIESYNLRITYSREPGGICCIATLEYIHQKYGFHVLDRTMRLCIGTWEGEANSLTANMLKGIAMMISTFGDAMKDDWFKEKVGEFTARDIRRTAKERRTGSMSYAESMLIAL